MSSDISLKWFLLNYPNTWTKDIRRQERKTRKSYFLPYLSERWATLPLFSESWCYLILLQGQYEGYETQSETCLNISGFCHVRVRQYCEHHCHIFNHAWKVRLLEVKAVTSFTSFNPWNLVACSSFFHDSKIFSNAHSFPLRLRVWISMNLFTWEMDTKQALHCLFQNKYLVLHIGEMKFTWVSQGCVMQKWTWV